MVTMKDIAKEANVSRPTVSLILNGHSDSLRISEETKTKVLEVAERLGYRRNEVVRSMIKGKTNFIGFIGESIEQEYTGKILSEIITGAQKDNYFVKVFPYGASENLDETARRIIEQRPAGLICHSLPEENLKYIFNECKTFGCPIVIIGSNFPHNWGIRIAANDIQGAELAVNHLIELGHKKIAHVGNIRGRGYVEERRQGYLNALQQANIEIPESYMIQDKAEHLDNKIGKLLSSKDRPTAIFCDSDHFAMIAMRQARKNGLRVPEDFSIVGYANFYSSKFTDPPLTSVAEPYEDIGRKALKYLINEINSTKKISFESEIDETVNVKLVMRKSTRQVT